MPCAGEAGAARPAPEGAPRVDARAGLKSPEPRVTVNLFAEAGVSPVKWTLPQG